MQTINTQDRLFHDGNPATGELGTIVPANWLNSIQAELLSVLAASSLTADPTNNNQLLNAIKQLAWNSTSARPSTLAGYGITDAAPINSPVLTGTPTAPTAAPSDNSTKLATTAFVQSTALFAAPPGQAAFFFMATPPVGWLKANGAAVSRTAYAALFAAIGTGYGAGDGSTTFNLPDLRGEFVRGWDEGRGIDSGRTFGSSQIATAIRVLIDNYAPSSSYPVGTFAIGMRNTDGSLGGSGSSSGTIGSDSIFYQNSATAVSGYGDNSSFTVRPRNLALLACIKY